MTRFKPVKKNIDGSCWIGVKSSIRTGVNTDSVNLVFTRVHREVFMPVRTRTYRQVMRGLLEDLTIP